MDCCVCYHNTSNQLTCSHYDSMKHFLSVLAQTTVIYFSTFNGIPMDSDDDDDDYEN